MAVKTAVKKRQSITSRQRKLVTVALENAKRDVPLTRGEMLEAAGYSLNSAKANTAKAFDAAGLRLAFAERGITPDTITGVLQDAALAKQGTWFKGQYLEDNAADHTIRLRAAEQLADLTGLKVTKLQVQSVNIALDMADLAAMMGI